MRTILIGAMLLTLGCQQAHRYPSARKPVVATPTDRVHPINGWTMPDRTPDDLPIRFVESKSAEWGRLPGFWNASPPPMAGMRTIHIGLPPLNAALAMRATLAAEEIVIKTPLGLGLPPADPLNPPTYGKWRLGKQIFFAKVFREGRSTLACADCHRPASGFADAHSLPLEGRVNTLSLLNVAYRKEFFWDGRAKSLEEVVVKEINDELEPAKLAAHAARTHRWGGAVARLDRDAVMREQFKLVFGIERVTQDAIAKALAVYMRTILSGDSIYDRANLADAKADRAAAFEAALSDDALASFRRGLPPEFATASKEIYAKKLAQGEAVFVGKGHCAKCHDPRNNFHDDGFHNVLVGDVVGWEETPGSETGRFNVLPIGRKDPAMRGAYRTPTLRNLPRTGPYFHDGARRSLAEAIDHYNYHLDKDHPLLARPLVDALRAAAPAIPGAHPPLFSDEERDSLLLFLHALDGQPVPSIVGNP